MSETMLALVALIVAVFFAISQQRAIVEAEREIASIEMEVLANAVGSEMMQQIAVKPFDAASVGVNPQDVALTDLTPSTAFGDSLDCPGVCDDIDDFNAMLPDTVYFEVDTDAGGDPVGFNFAITASVTYVDASGNPTSTPSWTKQVTLSIEQAVTGSEKKYLLRPILLKEEFSLQ